MQLYFFWLYNFFPFCFIVELLIPLLFVGACDCDAGFTGDDCSVAENDPPELQDIEGGGIIDISVGVPAHLVIYGADFVDSDKLTCHFVSNLLSEY